jgi:hypothetical protein
MVLNLYRCPMECRLTYDEHGIWQCQVLIRRETDANGNKIATREERFGPVLYDKDDLEEMLRRAQLAILNPSLPADEFVDFDTSTLEPGERPPGSERQLAFSNNVVCVDLSGPDVVDLSFIDLPGTLSLFSGVKLLIPVQESFPTWDMATIRTTSRLFKIWSSTI